MQAIQQFHSGGDAAMIVDRRISNAIAAFARGELLLVSDDEDRENEGDLIVAAEHATPDAINFMIKYGRGLVCLAVTPEIARAKQLRPMVVHNTDHMQTAFTVSVDGTRAHGITTGISAPERAKTIELIISDEYTAADLHAPGHMFPLVARAGGLLERRGHTEAAVELARLAGLKPAGVIVEVIKDDGTMARRRDLLDFAEKFSLHYITIAELVRYMERRAPARVAA